MRKRYITLLIVIAVLTARYFMDDISQRGAAFFADEKVLEPDYLMSGLHFDKYDSKGLLTQQIEASSAEHVPQDGSTRFADPKIILREGPQSKWGINALQASLVSEQSLQLNGKVHVIPLSEQESAYSLQTESLFIDLKAETANTQDPVTITSNHSQLDATGMNLSLREQKIELLSHVRGRHDPIQ